MNVLKEPALSSTFVEWTEHWEKDKWKTDSARNKVLFSIKCKDSCFVLPDDGHMYYKHEEDTVFK